MVAEKRLSLEKSLWFANQSRVKSLSYEAPLFPARGTSLELVNEENHDDHEEEERAHDDDREVKEEKS